MAWQLITTAPNAELHVERVMGCLSFEHHLFKTRRKVVAHGRVVERLFPYFPGYIFVRAQHCWTSVKNIIGVIDFVRIGGVVVDIAEHEITRLLHLCDSFKVLPVPDCSLKFRPGDRVRVTGSRSLIFGATGLYQNAIGLDKAYVLLPWFNGQLTGTVVDECDIESLEGHRVRHSASRKRRRRRTRPLRVETSALSC
jgi:hypothetical protein